MQTFGLESANFSFLSRFKIHRLLHFMDRRLEATDFSLPLLTPGARSRPKSSKCKECLFALHDRALTMALRDIDTDVPFR